MTPYLELKQPEHESNQAKNNRFPGGNKHTTHRQLLTVPSRKHRRKYDGVYLLQNMNYFSAFFFPSDILQLLSQDYNAFFFCLLLFIYPENHEIADGKITSLKGADMFVCLLLQAERGLSTSQQPGHQLYCRAATLKIKENVVSCSHSCLEEAKQKRQALDLPWESSFSSCHSGSLPRRRRCHLDCWGLREGWFWMVTPSHHGSVSVCLAVWNSAAPSFAGKTWVWKATGNEGEGMNEHSASCSFTPLLTLS